ncbi:MAG TPA: lamin tail domain-containing protein [Bacteroidia bacterium]
MVVSFNISRLQKYLIVLAIIIIGVCKSAKGQTTDLLISEYGEGSSGNSKYVELYNGTGASINLANYRIRTGVNGAALTAVINLSGTLADGSTYVIANNTTDVPGANLTSANASWNGDDAIALEKNTGSWVLLDVIGTIGSDPGTGWAVAGTANATVDRRLTRKATVCSPNTNWTTSAGTNTTDSEWTVSGAYTTGAANAGHTSSCGSTPTLTTSVASLTGFTYVVGSGPSASQSYNLSGTNLTGAPGNITVSGSTNYEVSNDNSTWGTSTTIAYSSATLAATPVYVRLKAGLAVGTYNTENVVNAGGGAATSPTVTCSGTVTGSAASDIITANGESATISSIINTTGPLTSAQGTQVWQFTIRDGGGSSDADNLATIVNQIIFSQAAGDAVGDWSTAIQAINLFDGSTNVGSGTVTSNQVTFSGLNINVPDNTNKTISVRLTLKCGLGSGNNDGDDFGFQISNGNVTFSSSGSGKSAFAAISTTNGQNAISIIATQLIFTQQPSTTSINSAMSPAVTVAATDICGNVDLGYTGTISLASSGTMTGAPLSTGATAGVATFSSIVHTVVGTGLQLTATASGLATATSSNFDINTITTLSPGDVAILAFNVNCDASGTDEISFVTFVDFTPGTTLDMTDNAYEKCGTTDGWGVAEGWVKLQRTTSTLPAGKVITLRVTNGVGTVVSPNDGNWTITQPQPAGQGQFNLNAVGEQIFFLQGGVVGGPGNSTATSDAGTYTPLNILFGFNTKGNIWTPICGNAAAGGTQNSAKPRGRDCFLVWPTAQADYNKYKGPITTTSVRLWIERINDPNNWVGYADDAAFDANTGGGYDYVNYNGANLGMDLPISSGGFSAGQWVGTTNTDWFECSNWQNLRVPDSTVSVNIDNVTNDPVVGAPTVTYPNGAFANNLTISNTSGAGVLTLNTATSLLTIKGNVTNNGIITGSNGHFSYRGTTTQTHSGSGTTSLYNMWLENSNGLTISQDITVTNQLKFNYGVLSTGSNKLVITNTTVPTITGYSTSKFINGNLRHSIASNTSTYILPLGYGTSSADYHPANFVNGNITGVTYLDTYVNSITESGNNIDSRVNTSQQGEAIIDVVNTAEWNITPNAAASGGTYGVDLYVTNISGLIDNQFVVVKRPNASTDYADWNTFETTTFIPTAGSNGRITSSGAGYATRNNYSSFSKFAIGKIANIVLPADLLNFSGKRSANKILLSWESATEINLNQYEVEKSADALNYTSLGKVTASYNRGGTYHLYDETPVEGLNYYKLFTIDNDGKRTFQKTISVNYMAGQVNDFTISYSDDKVCIILNDVTLQTEVKMYNLTGQLVKIFTNEELMSGNLIINNSDYAKGMYILRVGQKFSSTSDKIIIR